MLPNKDLIFRLLNLNRVLLWGSVFRGEGSGNEDNFLNSGCCAGPRFQAGKVPPLSPATSCFSSHLVFQSTTRQTGKQFIFDLGCSPRDSSGISLFGASDVACGEGDRPVSSGARVIDDTSGGYADLLGSNAEGADSVSRALLVVSCARDLALDPVVSTAASPGSRLLRVLVGGHSADHGGCSGAGIAACSSGIERLRRQACCNFRDLVGGLDSLSSHHDGDTNSCWDTHVARANSRGTLHAARSNSGGHVNSYQCTYYSCGEVRG